MMQGVNEWAIPVSGRELEPGMARKRNAVGGSQGVNVN